MWNRRYPHGAAGKVAVLPFAAAALLAGWIEADTVPAAPPVVFAVSVWAIVGGGVAYLVFSSQGVTRPASMMQAAVADGVVTGIITGSLGTIIITATTNGSDAGARLSGWGVVAAIALASLAGAAIGAVLGGAVALVGGSGVFARQVSSRRGRRR